MILPTKFTETTVAYCDHCLHPMTPNISTGDEEGFGWTCYTFDCPDYNGTEVEVEDLTACGCPEWLAERLVTLIDSLAEEN